MGRMRIVLQNVRTGRGRLLVLGLALGFCGGVTVFGSAASAQLATDTEITPVAKPSQRWTPVGGAKFGSDGELVERSPTRAATDLFSVDFVDQDHGFMAGAVCRDAATPFDELPSCDRAPVIYEYSIRNGVAVIAESVRASGSGFVGAVSWIGPGRALAVGGTGDYPRREPSRLLGETDAEYGARDRQDGSGRARAWLYSAGGWRELHQLPDGTNGDEIPDAMGALTAVDCSPRETDVCLAGGLQQIWRWEGDSFSDTPETSLTENPDFRYRVRQLRFDPRPKNSLGAAPEAYAVTTGCCAEAAAAAGSGAGPRLLTKQSDSWSVAPFGGENDAGANEATAAVVPDSFYSVLPSILENGALKLSVVASPGGPDRSEMGPPDEREAGSRIYTGSSSTTNNHDTPLEGVRLVAGDGDFSGPPSTILPLLLEGEAQPADVPPDGVLDWAVGSLRPSSQGAAYTTLIERDRLQNPSGCGAFDPLPDGQGCSTDQTLETTGDAESVGESTESQRLVSFPTYALNAFTFADRDAGSVAWAVGDRGAVVRLGGGGTVGGPGEGAPPRLGKREAGSFPSTEPWGESRPEPRSDAGSVPAAASQPTRVGGRPSFVATGAPSPTLPFSAGERVTSMALSRDGGEGWAVGSGRFPGGALVLYHFDGIRWSSCRREGVEGLIQADPACSDLAPLDAASPSVSLTQVARVPLEKDDDPTNDDEFEVVAIGTTYIPPKSNINPKPSKQDAILRYRHGQWALDEQSLVDFQAIGQEAALLATYATDMAFAAPDDGWIVGGFSKPFVIHFDGDRWRKCSASDPQFCDDEASGLLPLAAGSASTDLRLEVAGDRIYLAGTRFGGGDANTAPLASSNPYPMILYKDRSGNWLGDTSGGAYDPGCESRDPASGDCIASTAAGDRGQLGDISVAAVGPEKFAGWVSGKFGSDAVSQGVDGAADVAQKTVGSDAALLRLDPAEGTWRQWTTDDATSDYLFDAANVQGARLLSVAAAEGGERALILPGATSTHQPRHPVLSFNRSRDRWEVQPTPFLSTRRKGAAKPQQATISAAYGDGSGGVWIAALQTINGVSSGDVRSSARTTFFYHLTDRPAAPVFTDAPHPIRAQITDLTGSADGSLWVTTDGGIVYRYDRVTGWAKVPIPGWDAGRTATKPSRANAVAVSPDGDGVVVGRGGRIADVSSTGAVLDEAAGTVCAAPTPPCGTSRDLRAAAVAPDGSAMVAGDALSLLWRPAGGGFRSISRPSTTLETRLTGVALPTPDRAWLTSGDGDVFVGERSGLNWSWRLESTGPDGEPLARDALGAGLALRDIAVNAAGHGYAVGERGVVLERVAEANRVWRRVDTGFEDELYSVALPAGGLGESALIGGGLGLILTYTDGRFQIARPADFSDPITNSLGSVLGARVPGVALLPGYQPGQVEAWAGSQVQPFLSTRNPPPSALLHFSNTPGEPLLNLGAADPIDDSLSATSSELTLAAFGRSECHLDDTCPEAHTTSLQNEAIAAQIVDEIAVQKNGHGIDAAFFTGDVANAAGRDTGAEAQITAGAGPVNSLADKNTTQRRWVEMVANRLADSRTPLFGVLGRRDLSQLKQCGLFAGCVGDRQAGAALGSSELWQGTMAAMPAPWGDEPHESSGDLAFVPLRHPAKDGRAQTHYALDVTDTSTTPPKQLARLVVLDNSLGSLAASDANQNPVEEQSAWLEDVLCIRGSATDRGQCTRPEGERAIVAFSTPTYSHASQISPTDYATDTVALETTLLRHKVDVAIAGGLGWNGVYWTLAPGLHDPAPGSDPPDPNKPPEPPATAPSGPGDAVIGEVPVGAMPTVVSSSAGGRFNESAERSGDTPSSDGFWHGYSVIHLDPETGEVGIEQRPIFDWIGIEAKAHVLHPKQRLTLNGYGREPAGMDTPLFYDEINSHSITHRYDLLVADPDKPWVPLPASEASAQQLQAANRSPGAFRSRLAVAATATDPQGTDPSNPCDPYLCLDPEIATVDPTTGEVRSGDGNSERAFAIGLLSVGEQSATWPLAFEPRPSFRPATSTLSPTPRPGASPPPPPPPPGVPNPGLPQLNLPTPPNPPQIPTVAAVPPAAVAALPPPPAPPTQSSSAPLELFATVEGISISPQTTVPPPPPPPVNPAPPGGARKEARQRQAAVQKGEEGSGGGEGAEEGRDPADAQGQSDPVNSPNQSATRLSGGRDPLPFSRRSAPRSAAASFTPVASSRQDSLGRGALYAAGMTLAALALAAGFTTLRPGPRRHRGPSPAPAWAPQVSYGRRRS